MISALQNVDYNWTNPLTPICAITPGFSLLAEVVQISSIRKEINSSKYSEDHVRFVELQERVTCIQYVHMYGAACRTIVFLALAILIHPAFMVPLLVECYQYDISVNLNDYTIDETTYPEVVTMNNPWTGPLRRFWECFRIEKDNPTVVKSTFNHTL